MNALVPLPVLLPLCATGLSLAFGTRLGRFQRFISVAVLTAVTALSAILMVAADRQGPLSVHLGDFAPPLGITLVADRLSGLMLTVSSAITLWCARLLPRPGHDRPGEGSDPARPSSTPPT
ncbi:hypothetical protein SBADM41S_02060 [Streptomyces badius]